MGADEVGTLEALKAARSQIVDPSIAGYRGRIVKTTGRDFPKFQFHVQGQGG